MLQSFLESTVCMSQLSNRTKNQQNTPLKQRKRKKIIHKKYYISSKLWNHSWSFFVANLNKKSSLNYWLLPFSLTGGWLVKFNIAVPLSWAHEQVYIFLNYTSTIFVFQIQQLCNINLNWLPYIDIHWMHIRRFSFGPAPSQGWVMLMMCYVFICLCVCPPIKVQP